MAQVPITERPGLLVLTVFRALGAQRARSSNGLSGVFDAPQVTPEGRLLRIDPGADSPRITCHTCGPC